MKPLKASTLIPAGTVCIYLLHILITSNDQEDQLVVAAVDDAAPYTATSDQQAMDGLTHSFRKVVKQTLPAVVSVRTITKRSGVMRPSVPDDFRNDPFRDHPFFRDFFDQFPDDSLKGDPGSRPWNATGLGSGFLIDPSGIILTNAHVVNGVDEITVQLGDGREFTATEVKVDVKADLAIIRIAVNEKLPSLPIGDEQELEIGDWVLAFGSPFGLHRTVTQGIISAKSRGLNDPRLKQELLQTDAAINPGNSGGPLVNLRGEVVGVNTAISTSSGGYDGVGFAIPASLAKWVAEQLEKHGRVRRAYIGVMAQDIDSGLAASLGLDTPHGALIAEITKGSPAEKAGLHVQDVVTELNGEQITNTRKLMAVAERLSVGQKYPLEFLREGRRIAVEVTMAELPERLLSQESGKTESEESGGDTVIVELGISVRSVTRELADELGLGDVRGVVISSVKQDSFVASLGIQVGDVIFRMGTKDVNTAADVRKGIEEAKENRRILLYIRTTEGTRFISVPLVPSP